MKVWFENAKAMFAQKKRKGDFLAAFNCSQGTLGLLLFYLQKVFLFRKKNCNLKLYDTILSFISLDDLAVLIRRKKERDTHYLTICKMVYGDQLLEQFSMFAFRYRFSSSKLNWNELSNFINDLLFYFIYANVHSRNEVAIKQNYE